MHNILTRLQNVFGFFTSVAGFIALAIAAVSLLSMPTPSVDSEKALVMKNVQVVQGRPHYYSQKKEEYAHVKFDLDVDLSSLFTWNTKQLFLYVTATYPPNTFTPSSNLTSILKNSKNLSNPPTRAIIWDAILPHPNSPPHHNQYIGPLSTRRSSSKAKKPDFDGDVWDKEKPGILRLRGQRPKYQITDPTGRLATRANASLELNYNIQPWVGALSWGYTAPTAAEVGAAKKIKAPRSKGLMGTVGEWGSVLTWKRLVPEQGRSASFDFPALRDRGEAARAAGSDGLGTEKGKERNRGSPE